MRWILLTDFRLTHRTLELETAGSTEIRSRRAYGELNPDVFSTQTSQTPPPSN